MILFIVLDELGNSKLLFANWAWFCLHWFCWFTLSFEMRIWMNYQFVQVCTLKLAYGACIWVLPLLRQLSSFLDLGCFNYSSYVYEPLVFKLWSVTFEFWICELWGRPSVATMLLRKPMREADSLPAFFTVFTVKFCKMKRASFSNAFHMFLLFLVLRFALAWHFMQFEDFFFLITHINSDFLIALWAYKKVKRSFVVFLWTFVISSHSMVYTVHLVAPSAFEREEVYLLA